MSLENALPDRLDFPNQNVTAHKVIDPRLQMSVNRDYAVLRGAQVNSAQQFAATNYNNSSV